MIFPATIPSLYTCLRIQNCYYCLLSLLCRGRRHWNMDMSSPCLKILRRRSSKPKTQVAALSETSVSLSVITSYPRIIKYWYLLPFELQKSGSKISLFIASNSLEQSPCKAANLCQRIQRFLLNSTVRCLLHKGQPYVHTLSYYFSYNLTWPNIYPRVFNMVSFLSSSFVVIILGIFQIPGMCSTCFTHLSCCTNSISSVT